MAQKKFQKGEIFHEDESESEEEEMIELKGKER